MHGEEENHGFDCSESIPSFFFPVCAFSVCFASMLTRSSLLITIRDSSGKQTTKSVLGVWRTVCMYLEERKHKKKPKHIHI